MAAHGRCSDLPGRDRAVGGGVARAGGADNPPEAWQRFTGRNAPSREPAKYHHGPTTLDLDRLEANTSIACRTREAGRLTMAVRRTKACDATCFPMSEASGESGQGSQPTSAAGTRLPLCDPAHGTHCPISSQPIRSFVPLSIWGTAIHGIRFMLVNHAGRRSRATSSRSSRKNASVNRVSVIHTLEQHCRDGQLALEFFCHGEIALPWSELAPV